MNEASRVMANSGGNTTSVGTALGSILSEGFMKAKSVFGGVANSVQTSVNATYNEPPPQQKQGF